jgi:hypothetical protein
MEVQHSEKPQEVALGMTVLTCNYGESLKSITTWAKRWGWSRNKVYRYVKLLESRNMIATKSEQVTTRLRVCNYSRYDPKQNADGTPDRTQIERKQNADRTQADTDNNAKHEKNVEKDRYSPNSNEFRLASLLLNLILERKPDFRKPSLQKWAVHIDRMIRLDHRKSERIEAAIRWCQKDDFWQNNILSTEKLRKHFDRLELEMARNQKDGSHKIGTDTGPAEPFIR